MQQLQHYCFFDLETTGTSTTKDKIVEISAIKTDLNFKRVGDPLKYYINPECPIPEGATALHGVTDEMVKDAPKFGQVAHRINEFMRNCILAGYNIMHFDVPLLSEEFARAGICWPETKPLIVDALKIMRLKEVRTLGYALKFYTGKDMQDAHQAENDNIATIDIVAGQMEMYADLKAMPVEEVANYCNEGKRNLDLEGKVVLNDNNVPVYSFGKHKDVPVVNVRDYGKWLLGADFSNNTKFVVGQILGM